MNKTIKIMKIDTKANKGNLEVIIFLAVFRICGLLKKLVKKGKARLFLLPVYLFFRFFYKLLSMIYLMEIPVGTQIGSGLTIYHLKGIVINDNAKIGNNVTINHFTTISDDVEIANGVIINSLSVVVKGSIGENSVVGAGSVVTKDVAKNTIVAGCPARPIGSTT